MQLGNGVSSKDIQKARQNAKRTRAYVACGRCKTSKVACSNYRPCKRCAGSGNSRMCTTTVEGTASHTGLASAGPIMQPRFESTSSGTFGQGRHVFVGCDWVVDRGIHRMLLPFTGHSQIMPVNDPNANTRQIEMNINMPNLHHYNAPGISLPANRILQTPLPTDLAAVILPAQPSHFLSSANGAVALPGLETTSPPPHDALRQLLALAAAAPPAIVLPPLRLGRLG